MFISYMSGMRPDLLFSRSKTRSKPKKKTGQRRSRTPSSLLDSSVREITTQQSGICVTIISHYNIMYFILEK